MTYVIDRGGLMAANWRRMGWVAKSNSEARDRADDLEVERDQAIVDEIPDEYWPATWFRRLSKERRDRPREKRAPARRGQMELLR